VLGPDRASRAGPMENVSRSTTDRARPRSSKGRPVASPRWRPNIWRHTRRRAVCSRSFPGCADGRPTASGEGAETRAGREFAAPSRRDHRPAAVTGPPRTVRAVPA